MENELLTDEQLEKVAGGAPSEAKDLAFMQTIGALSLEPQTYDDVQRAWARMGISFVLHTDNTPNQYFDSKGNKITREAALKTALKKKKSKINLDSYL